MKTTTKINQMTRKIVLTIASLLFVMSMNSAQNMHLNHEMVLTGLIKQAYSNTLALNRSISGSPVLTADPESEVMLEKWMINSGNWNHIKNTVNVNYLLKEEIEQPLEIEDWMLKDFSTSPTINAATDNSPEETVTLEAWMVNPATWGKN